MAKRIKHLIDSPCWTCEYEDECLKRRHKNDKLNPIVDMIWDKADYNRMDCPIWIAINAPEMVEGD